MAKTMTIAKMARILVVMVLMLVASACRSKTNLKGATLQEGRGIESLVLGTTTLSQAVKTLGGAAGEPSTSSTDAQLEALPLRLQFAAAEGGGEPVLETIYTSRTENKTMPNWEGKTSRGIGLLDSVEKMHTAYGEPDAEWRQSWARVYYYKSGVLFSVEHPSRVRGYEGPPPTPTSGVITSLAVTLPFEVLEPAKEAMHSGQLSVTGPPKTSLRHSPPF